MADIRINIVCNGSHTANVGNRYLRDSAHNMKTIHFHGKYGTASIQEHNDGTVTVTLNDSPLSFKKILDGSAAAVYMATARSEAVYFAVYDKVKNTLSITQIAAKTQNPKGSVVEMKFDRA